MMWLSTMIAVTTIKCTAVAVQTPDTYRRPMDIMPQEAATLVGQAFVHNANNFLNWEGGFTYGPAVVADGLLDASSMVSVNTSKDWMETLDKYLDLYLSPPQPTSSAGSVVDCTTNFPYGPATQFRSCGFALQSATRTIPWNATILGTVGDRFGVFPIAFLGRYLHETTTTESKANVADLAVAVNAATQYVLDYQFKLGDGTFSREGGCCDGGEPNLTQGPFYVWADDQFMGLTLLSRLAACSRCGLAASVRRQFVDVVATMQLSFSQHLRDPTDGLTYHGAKSEPGVADKHSCCKWGRANGWGLLSHVEVLAALDVFPSHPLRERVLTDFETSIEAIVKFQHESGRWHQVVNDSTTFLETSVTAMVITSLATALNRGWLNNTHRYTATLITAWKGLSTQISNTGVVIGVCMGTGIEPNVSSYNARGTDYYQSSPGGVGAILRACKSLHQFLREG